MENTKKPFNRTIMPFYYTRNKNGNFTCVLTQAMLESFKQLKVGDCLLFRVIDHNKSNTRVDAFLDVLPERDDSKKDAPPAGEDF